MATVTHACLTQQVSNNIATLAINHPPANTLTRSALVELEETLDTLAENDRIHVIILTGSGRFFCAGADIHAMMEMGSSQEAGEFAGLGQRVFQKIALFSKPVIAAINGVCLGGGLEMALSCHIRLVAEGVQLGLPEVQLGLIPGFGGTQRLSRLIGTSKACEMILTGDLLTAQESRQLGLVSHVIPANDLLPYATALARRIASKSQPGVRAALQSILKGAELGMREGLELEKTLFEEVFQTEDRKEGMTAFFEKRPPHFKNT